MLAVLELLIPARDWLASRVYCGISMIAKDFVPEKGIRSFVIMKRLVRRRFRESHPPRLTHSPRIPGAFIAGRVIVGLYSPYCGGKGPQ